MLNKGWRVHNSLGTQTIFTPTSFDQDKKEFGYRVNTNTGVATPLGTL